MEQLDFTRTIRTVNGNMKVVILTQEGPSKAFPVVGYIEGMTGVYEWSMSGICYSDDDLHIQSEPPKEAFSVIVSNDGAYEEELDADCWKNYGCILQFNVFPEDRVVDVIVVDDVKVNIKDKSGNLISNSNTKPTKATPSKALVAGYFDSVVGGRKSSDDFVKAIEDI